MKRIISLFLASVILISVGFNEAVVEAATYTKSIAAFTYNGYSIPAYDGDIVEVINKNNPKFTSSQLNQKIYEKYGALDSLGRVTTAIANIDQTLMPTGSRGSISSVTPTGWKQKKYDCVSGKYLYNRSHLIGWQLTGENANKKNLMTGTRKFNAPGMVDYENKVASYIKENKKNNVLYRVTPVFKGNNKLATGVIMEAKSVDDNGARIKFCIFVYNVQPGVSINYATGDSIKTGSSTTSSSKPSTTSIVSLKKNGRKVTVKWKKKSYSGYQVQIATNSKFTKNKKSVTVKGSKTVSKTITAPVSSKGYYVRVRTYKIKNSKKVYSSWCKKKYVGKAKSSSSSNITYVYITPTGIKYHKSSACAGKNAIKKKLSDVKSAYDPCKKCAC